MICVFFSVRHTSQSNQHCMSKWFLICFAWFKIINIDSINNNPDPNPEDIGLKFYYTEKIFEEIQYIRAIPFENWLSNVGGFVGIFLGYSMIQFPEFLICLAHIFGKNRIENVSGMLLSGTIRILLPQKRNGIVCESLKPLNFQELLKQVFIE